MRYQWIRNRWIKSSINKNYKTQYRESFLEKMKNSKKSFSSSMSVYLSSLVSIYVLTYSSQIKPIFSEIPKRPLRVTFRQLVAPRS